MLPRRNLKLDLHEPTPELYLRPKPRRAEASLTHELLVRRPIEALRVRMPYPDSSAGARRRGMSTLQTFPYTQLAPIKKALPLTAQFLLYMVHQCDMPLDNSYATPQPLLAQGTLEPTIHHGSRTTNRALRRIAEQADKLHMQQLEPRRLQT